MSIRQRTWTTNGVEHKAWQVSYTDANGKRQRPQGAASMPRSVFENPAAVRHPHFSDRSRNLSADRHGVKDYFPNYILDVPRRVDRFDIK